MAEMGGDPSPRISCLQAASATDWRTRQSSPQRRERKHHEADRLVQLIELKGSRLGQRLVVHVEPERQHAQDERGHRPVEQDRDPPYPVVVLRSMPGSMVRGDRDRSPRAG
jgi:hypothetical protein